MIDVPVYDMRGNQTGSVQVDEKTLGGRVRYDLIKQAVVMWTANQRQGSARTKSRGMVVGSTRKLYRQKGTGNARAGNARTNIRRGGGVAFAKLDRDFRRAMPKKMRQQARNSALLAKIKSGSVVIVDPMEITEPKTKAFYGMLKALGAHEGCLFATQQRDPMVHKSGRNIPRTDLRPVQELNAYEILRRKKVVFTRPAFEAVLADPATYGAALAKE
jgi:large subunit ribosomal protein L4